MTLIAPHPFGHTVNKQQLLEQFSQAHSWEDRYRQLILLSRQLPTLADEYKQQQIELSGCENRVWLNFQLYKLEQQDELEHFHFYGDSEGRVVKGLLAILFTQVEGLTAEQILATDLLAFYQQLGISQSLSASRSNGLLALIERVQQIAKLQF